MAPPTLLPTGMATEDYPDTLAFLGKIITIYPEVESLLSTDQLASLDLDVRLVANGH